MRIKEWAEENGIRYQTALTWFHKGTLPVPAKQLPTGTILVYPDEPNVGRTVGYARVSSSDQKQDLERQVARLATSGHEASEYVTEVGSAMNGRRPKLVKLLSDPTVTTIIVEHRDRLARFGFEYIEACLKARGGGIIVLDDTETADDDLVRDMADVLTSFCARLYGARGAKNRAARAMKATHDD